jgi:serine protease Do
MRNILRQLYFFNPCLLNLLTLTAVSVIAFTTPAYADDVEDSLKYANGLSTAFQNVADAIAPAVVNISSVKRAAVQSVRGGAPNPFQGSPFERFFGDEFFERMQPPQGPPGGFSQQGLGTGVIVNSEGYILTNNHVVEGADEITVRLSDKRSFKAKIVGTDAKTDLAVIKIDAHDLVPAKLGDSTLLKIGEWVVASGNPFGLDHTITAGIVSAKGRSNVGIVDYEDFIQTDAAINPGNSGGPLLNLKGEVVGINAAIVSKSGGSMGIGFAIPINMAKAIMGSLIDKGRVIRGWLGVAIQNLDEDLAQSFNHSGTEGALIGEVTPEGPADKAGLQQGDIVVRFNGKPVKDITQFRSMVAETTPEVSAEIAVMRDGKERTVSVRIGEQKNDPAVVKPSESAIDLGFKVQSVTPDIAAQLGLDRVKGVVVIDIQSGSVAEEAGLRPRDVIVDVNGSAVKDLESFQKTMKRQDLKKGVRFVVQSGEYQRFVFLRSRP